MLAVETKKKNCTMNTGSKSRNQTARAALYNTGILCVCMVGVVVYFAQQFCWEHCFFLLEALQVT